MHDKLLDYYHKQLHAIKTEAKVFAQTHPQLAGHLLQDHLDPYLAHLIEAFAFLTAKLQLKLNDDLQPLSQSLLNILYPHFNAPIPTLVLTQWVPQSSLNHAHIIDKQTELSIQLPSQQSYLFQTCQNLKIYPLCIKNLQFDDVGNHHSQLDIGLCTINPEINLSNVNIDYLRFFINLPADEAFTLYELIFNQCSTINFSCEQKTTSLKRSNTHIKSVGFADNQGILPYPENAHIAFRLLTEYACFYQKFLFFDIEIPPEILLNNSTSLQISLQFKKNQPHIALSENKNFLLLNVSPMINLFKANAKPIAVDYQQNEYHLIADHPDQNTGIEIHSIEHIDAFSHTQQTIKIAALFDHTIHPPPTNPTSHTLYWLALRKANRELFLQLNHTQQPTEPLTLIAQLNCCHRQAAESLNRNPTRCYIDFWKETDEQIERIIPISHFTEKQTIQLQHDQIWQLLSHLQFSHSNLFSDEITHLLKQMLKLYVLPHSSPLQHLITQIDTIQAKVIRLRHPKQPGQIYCHGTKVIITLNLADINDKAYYLFGCILSKFLTLFSRINHFTQLSIHDKRLGELATWKPELSEPITL